MKRRANSDKMAVSTSTVQQQQQINKAQKSSTFEKSKVPLKTASLVKHGVKPSESVLRKAHNNNSKLVFNRRSHKFACVVVPNDIVNKKEGEQQQKMVTLIRDEKLQQEKDRGRQQASRAQLEPK